MLGESDRELGYVVWNLSCRKFKEFLFFFIFFYLVSALRMSVNRLKLNATGLFLFLFFFQVLLSFKYLKN